MTVLPAPPGPTHDLGSTRFTSLATPSRGSTETAVWIVEIDPGTPATPHSLTREEVFVVLDGTAEVALGDDRAVARAGDAFVVPVAERLRGRRRRGRPAADAVLSARRWPGPHGRGHVHAPVGRVNASPNVPLARLMGMAFRQLVDDLHGALRARGWTDVRESYGFVLLAIRDQQTTTGELAGLLGVSKQATSKLLEAMEAGRFRDSAPGERRRSDEGRDHRDAGPGAARRGGGDLCRAGGRVGRRDRRGGPRPDPQPHRASGPLPPRRHPPVPASDLDGPAGPADGRDDRTVGACI